MRPNTPRRQRKPAATALFPQHKALLLALQQMAGRGLFLPALEYAGRDFKRSTPLVVTLFEEENGAYFVHFWHCSKMNTKSGNRISGDIADPVQDDWLCSMAVYQDKIVACAYDTRNFRGEVLEEPSAIRDREWVEAVVTGLSAYWQVHVSILRTQPDTSPIECERISDYEIGILDYGPNVQEWAHRYGVFCGRLPLRGGVVHGNGTKAEMPCGDKILVLPH